MKSLNESIEAVVEVMRNNKVDIDNVSELRHFLSWFESEQPVLLAWGEGSPDYKLYGIDKLDCNNYRVVIESRDLESTMTIGEIINELEDVDYLFTPIKVFSDTVIYNNLRGWEVDGVPVIIMK